MLLGQVGRVEKTNEVGNKVGDGVREKVSYKDALKRYIRWSFGYVNNERL